MRVLPGRNAAIALMLSGLAMAVAPSVEAATRVYLLRGLADVSTGLDDLAVKLKRQGMMAIVDSHTSQDAVAARVVAEHKSGDSIVIIGHSLGADAGRGVAETLSAKGLKVALLVAFSPASTGPVPGNVARAINYYQSNSLWNNILRAGRGFKGSLSNVDLAADEAIHHFNIEKAPRLHAAIIAEVKRVAVRDLAKAGESAGAPVREGSSKAN